jgi:ribosomal protein S18 acetylase RimI-like enzyme
MKLPRIWCEIVFVKTWKRATRDDLPALRAWLAADAATFELLDGAPPREDEAERMLDDVPPDFPLERNHSFLVDEAAFVGLLEGYPDPTTWFLGLIYVVPDARNTGLGTRLLLELIEGVRERGGKALRLAVVVENVAARRLYDRLGFQHVVRKARTAWNGNEHILDVLELAL